MKIDKDIITNVYRLREKLHKIPEASMHETETKHTLMSFLKEYTDLEIVDRGVWFYAVMAAGEGCTKREPIAFRADMDAVCGQDGRPGHYCGHDGHSSIMCGAAMAMERRGEIDRDVYFIFQPGEETGAGAKLCWELITEQNIGEIYGLHNIPGYPKRHVLLADGTFACASTGLEIHMSGTPSHAAYPEAGKNPGPALARLLLEVEKLTETYNKTRGFVRMTLIGMDVGSANYGVAASEGTLRLTVRAEGENIFAEYVNEIRRIAQDMASDGGFTCTVDEIERFPATENHAENVDKLKRCAARQGIMTANLAEPMRWSEDFGYYLRETKGAFFGIGDGEDYAQLHTADYEFPDDIVETAIRMFAGLALM